MSSKFAFLTIVFLLVAGMHAFSAGGTPTVSSSEEIIEIDWLGAWWGDNPPAEGNFIQKALEDKFNVKINNVTEQDSEKLAIIMSAGDFPDYSGSWVGDYDRQKLYEDGVTRSISKSMLDKNAPEYVRRHNKYQFGWRFANVPGKTDEFYSMVAWNYALREGGFAWEGMFFRYDWLEKAGLVPSAAKKMYDAEKFPDVDTERFYIAPTSLPWDWFQDVLKAFRDDDLDGNGKDDSVALGLSTHFRRQQTLWGMFGIERGRSVLENGELKMPEISEAYKAYLKQMQQWYKGGYIEKEFTTLDDTKWKDKMISTANTGCHNYHAIYMAPLHTYAAPMGKTIEAHPEIPVKWMVTTGVTGPTGKAGSPMESGRMWYERAVIGAQVDDTELAKILQIYDYVNFNKEFVGSAKYGVEGQDFRWMGAPYNSPVEKINDSNFEGQYGWYYRDDYETEENELHHRYPIYMPLYDFFYWGDAPKKYGIKSYKEDLFNETKYRDVNKEVSADLNTHMEVFNFKAIIGEVDIDAEWDAYVTKWRAIGGDRLLAELEKAPIVEDFLKDRKIVY